jgi:hypothetical protein
MSSLIFQVISWPTLLTALLVWGFAPGAVLRLIVLVYPRDHPRRRELLGELYAYPLVQRPFWVAQQLEIAFFEGLRGRFSAWRTARKLRSEPRATRTVTGWRVGDEEVSDLTSAMVLADLLAADLPAQAMPAELPADTGPPTGRSAVADESHAVAQDPLPDVHRLQQTVAQLEHALTARVKVEQAIGVLAERHQLPLRAAFDLLRTAAESCGKRVVEIAGDVVQNSNNPEHPIPDELRRTRARL